MNISSLKSADFRLYLAGSHFATNALWMLRVIVGWIAWDLTHLASFVGLIAFLNYAPTMIAGPLFGVLIDRVDVRRAALIAQSAFMGLALLLWALFNLDALGTPQLMVYALVVGFVMAAHGPIRMSLAPRLVDRAYVYSVVNIVAINFNITRMIGPAIAGLAIAALGTGPAIFLTALFYLPFLAALSMLRVRASVNSRETPPPFWGALKEGCILVVKNSRIRHALLLTAASGFFVRGALEILPVIADGNFARGAAGLGILTSATGFGAIVAGVWIALSSHSAGQVRLVTARAAGVLGLVATALLGITTLWHAALALAAAMAFCATITGIVCQSAIQLDIDDNFRGRIMSLWAVVAVGTSAVGAAALGSLSDVVGYRQALPISAVAALAMIGLLEVKRRWR
ncbi:MAG: MFS transporter [Albidovulum sp.]|nr:MFS transporter [Albidovulum sp.]